MKITSIAITYTDGAQLNLDIDDFTVYLIRFLESLHGEHTPLIESTTVTWQRCKECGGNGLSILGGYCSCQTGRDLQRVEKRMAKPVGDAEE